MNGIRCASGLLDTTRLAARPRLICFTSSVGDNGEDAELVLPSTEKQRNEEATSFDDDDTLDSLPRDENDASFHQEIIDNGFVEEEDNGQPSEAMAPLSLSSLPEDRFRSVLQEYCIQNNPIDALSGYYQRTSPHSSVFKKSCFQQEGCTVADQTNGNEGTAVFWTSRFTCPISGTVYHSSLPIRPLLLNSNNDQGSLNADNTNTLVERRTKQVFGNYRVVPDSGDQKVAFSTKKAANKSAALAAILHLTSAPQSASATMKGSPLSASPQMPTTTTTTVTVTTAAMGIKRRHREPQFPDWVHHLSNHLYRLGIDAADLTISYRQERGATPSSGVATAISRNNAGWKCDEPTLLSCVLEIRKRVGENNITVVMGDPRPTKLAAIDNAVANLGKQGEVSSSSAIVAPSGQSWEEKKRILLCNSVAMTNYIVSIPAWANVPIPTSRQEQDETILYLYKLEIAAVSSSGKAGSGQVMRTPLGIAFTRKILPMNHDGVFEARQDFMGTERVVRLCKQSVIRLKDLAEEHNDGTTSEERVAWMIEFNRVLSSWKTYGKARHSFPPTNGSEPLKRTGGGQRPLLQSSIEQESSPNDRTYFIVPLTTDGDDAVDWHLLRRVASRECSPYMEPSSKMLRWRIVAYLLIPLAFVTYCMFAMLNEGFSDGVWQHGSFEWREIYCGAEILIIILVIAAAMIRIVANILRSRDILENHFLVQRRAGGSIYVVGKENEAKSPRLTGLFRFLREGPIAAKLVKSHAQNNDFLVDQHTATSQDEVYLLPELVYILPMPRDVIQLARHVYGFIPLLEREIQLAFAVEEMQRLSREDSEPLSSVAPLLKEATTLVPDSFYQRLEFLGDSVLGFFVAVTIMANNSPLLLQFDDIEECLSNSVSNDALYSAGLRIGVNHLLFTSQRRRKWRSAFAGKHGLNKSILNCYESITDNIISDVVESVLGAAFMHDMICVRDSAGSFGESKLAAGVFERLQLPIVPLKDVAPGAPTIKEDVPLVKVLGCCSNSGYPFDIDDAWQRQLIAFQRLFVADTHVLVQLERKRRLLLDILVELSDTDGLREVFQNGDSSILLVAAIAHDDDDDDDSNEIEDNNEGGNGKCTLPDAQGCKAEAIDIANKRTVPRLSRLRDMLFFVGAYALQLCITTELFQRYPDANEGALHTLRARAICDDVVAYIVFKAGIHKAVHGMDFDRISKFEEVLHTADSIGMEIWNENGGWVLVGGTTEFSRRCKLAHDYFQTPRYPGYAGGRLHGQKKKVKLDYTEEPVFVMKAVVGALVLMGGLGHMWECVGPLFEEVLVLSIEESLVIYKDSTIK